MKSVYDKKCIWVEKEQIHSTDSDRVHSYTTSEQNEVALAAQRNDPNRPLSEVRLDK